MRQWSLRSAFFGLGLWASSHSSTALGITASPTQLPISPSAVTSTPTNRANVDVAIRRIKALLIAEQGQNETRFDDLLREQKELQGRR